MLNIKSAGIIASFLLLFFFTSALNAGDARREFQKYINTSIEKVKETDNPVEKRKILNDMFNDLTTAIETVKGYNVPEEDIVQLEILKNQFTEKQDELNGTNGFEKVQDSQLNNFAGYVQQDIEQADTIVTISLTTLLLIIILAILIF